MTHIELRALIPAYALDALSPEEPREVEAHLPTCEECRGELVLMREVASKLATAVPTSHRDGPGHPYRPSGSPRRGLG